MIKSCLKQIEPVDDEIVELNIKIKKGVLILFELAMALGRGLRKDKWRDTLSLASS